MAESPCHTASPEPTQTAPSASDADTTQYWCYHCNKSVSIETLDNLPDIICRECKNGFVESIPATQLPPSSPPSLTPDHADDPSFGSQFLQVLRLISQAAREEDVPQHQPQGDQPENEFLRFELDGWDNEEDGDADGNENDENEENNRNEDEEVEENEGGDETEEGEDRSDHDDEENMEDTDYVEYLRRRRRDLLRHRLREFATQAGTRRNRIMDWAEILMGLEDNSIEFRLEVPESDSYVGNPEDYVDAAGYEALLQNLAENDGGRRGAPPAAKAAVLELPTVTILSEQDAIVCAICKDVINVGEKATKIPCGHGYHGDCIVPWLGSRNTCPVCRFELPTDDAEYEEERKKRVTLPSVGGASGSSGENSSSG
ncbi:hypothetical protein QYF36_004721 [Acer negundo]|nr:hypothetical protein QYF36_004721 [Acer negundo]